jgi:probable HAF family extracellular repeat protein
MCRSFARFVVSCALAAPVAALALPAPTDLNAPSFPFGFATAVNVNGQVVGYLDTGSGLRHAFSWTPAGGMIDLGTVGSDIESAAIHVSSDGQVSGQSVANGDPNSPQHAFSWTPAGGMIDLGTLGGASSYAIAASANGLVAGMSNTAIWDPHAFLWSRSGGMIDLGTLTGRISRANGVNDSGQVVGMAAIDDHFSHAFSWTAAGGMVDLGTLGGKFSAAEAVNGSGQVVGEASVDDTVSHAFSWTEAGGMVDLGTFGGTFCTAVAVNAGGQVVGYGMGPGNQSVHGFSWTAATGMVDLGSLGGSRAYPEAVNDRGLVVGHASLPGDVTEHAFAWTAASGMVDLGTLGGAWSKAVAVNDWQIVGASTLPGEATTHAVLWNLALVVSPTSYSFGDVKVGTAQSTIVTVSNTQGYPVSITSLAFDAASAPAYSLRSPPALPALVGANQTLDLQVDFAPGTAGPFSAALVVQSDDPLQPATRVVLSGNGVAAETPADELADVIAFFDSSVADGTLVGSGPGGSAAGRLNALRNMLKAAGDLIARGEIGLACSQLLDAYRRVDGASPPPDFAAGPSAATLRDDIVAIRKALLCP